MTEKKIKLGASKLKLGLVPKNCVHIFVEINHKTNFFSLRLVFALDDWWLRFSFCWFSAS